jgi:hypothetical protein
MSAMSAQYFAALSISSLASDDRSVSIDGDGSYISQSAIYQQLSHIENMAANFITRKPIALDFKHGVYSEVEYDVYQDFEFTVPSFSQQELISICVECLPNFKIGEPLSLCANKEMKVGDDHCALVFDLARKVANRTTGDRIPCKATLTNGEYTIVLSSSAGVVPGSYLLSVGLVDIGYYNQLPSRAFADVHAVQAVRVQCSKTKAVRTIPLQVGVPVSGTATFRDMCYYRFVADDPRQIITISVAPKAGSSGDPDLYVTNRFQGQVAVTRDNYVWSCASSGTSRIDILPDDANLPADVMDGRIFVIGVACNSEDADFELAVSTATPPACTVFNFASANETHSMAPPVSANPAKSGRTVLNCAERGCTLDLTLVEGECLHFAVMLPDTLDQGSAKSNPGSLVVLVHDVPGLASIAHATVVQQVNVPALAAAEQVNVHRGMGVHAGDTLAAQGLLVDESRRGHARGSSGPPSTTAAGLWPVVYASADVQFPDRECYTWRVSGGVLSFCFVLVALSRCTSLQASSTQGKVLMLISPAEWKYTRPMCYFSIYGHSLADVAGTSGEQGRRKKPVRLSLWRADLQPPLTKTQQLAQEVVSYVYEAVDAQLLSFADRKYDANNAAGSPQLRAQDDHNVTYCETDYPAMVQLLHAAGAAHGQVFYDLGCGCGKALLSAALSGIRFVKCVGVAVLPSLARAAVQAVGVLSVNHSSNSGADLFRTPRAPTPTQSAVPKGQDQRLDLMQLPSSSLV